MTPLRKETQMANKTQVQLYHDTLQGVIGERSELQKRVRELEAALREAKSDLCDISVQSNIHSAARRSMDLVRKLDKVLGSEQETGDVK